MIKRFFLYIIQYIKANIRYRRATEKWEVVDIQEATINWTDVGTVDRIYYYLWENGVGHRRVEVKHTEIGLYMTTERAYSHPYYLTVIYPWLIRAKPLKLEAFKYPKNVIPFRKK